jgi:hypothetical protein
MDRMLSWTERQALVDLAAFEALEARYAGRLEPAAAPPAAATEVST